MREPEYKYTHIQSGASIRCGNVTREDLQEHPFGYRYVCERCGDVPSTEVWKERKR